MTHRLRTLCLFCALPLALAVGGAGAQDANPAAPAVARPSVSINYRERPRYPYESQRLKGRPTLDGAIHENEWDPFYTLSDGPVKGTVFLNWDDDFLYVAARTDQPAWFAFDLDANADGWLRGADNLELVVAPLGAEGAPLIVRLLDAASSKDAPAWNEKVVDPRSIQMVQKAAGAGQIVEIAIPKGIAGLRPRVNATLSCRADFLPSGVFPAMTAPYEPHLLLDVTLMEARAVAAPGLAPRLKLEDDRLVPGQMLKANLELLSQVDEEQRVRSVTWQGEGSAADLLKSVREVNIAPVKGFKNLKLAYSTVLPETAVLGTYRLSALVTLESGRTISATTTFAVVEPFSVQARMEPEPITVVGPTRARVFVEISSAVPGYVRGDLEVETPAGWEVKGRKKKEFVVVREDTVIRPFFHVTLPSLTPGGDYPINATVTWRGKVWKARTNVRVNRQAEPAAPRNP